jgi:hypothetical protein
MLSALFGGATSLYGILSANAAQQKAEQQRQQALTQMAQTNDQTYQNALNQSDKTIQQAAGIGGDGILNLSRNLGSNLAAGGVYNSSAVAGATASAQRGTDTALANEASQLQLGALGQKTAGQQHINDLQFGAANSNVNYAQNNLQTARGGMGSFLGSLAQSNLLSSGANSGRMNLPAVNGTVNQGDGLPGNASVLNMGDGPLKPLPGLVPANNPADPFGLQGGYR